MLSVALVPPERSECAGFSVEFANVDELRGGGVVIVV